MEWEDLEDALQTFQAFSVQALRAAASFSASMGRATVIRGGPRKGAGLPNPLAGLGTAARTLKLGDAWASFLRLHAQSPVAKVTQYEYFIYT